MKTEKLTQWEKDFTEAVSLPNPPKNFLFFGAPGFGKSNLAFRMFPKVERITLAKGMFSDALFGKFLLPDGKTEYFKQYAALAAEGGYPLIIDELDHMGLELESTIHSICDDPEVCRLNLDNGESVKPKAGFKVIATMNSTPDVLSQPILDRFQNGLILNCDKPANGIADRMREDVRLYFINQVKNKPAGDVWTPTPSPRTLIAFCNFVAQGVPDEKAARWVFHSGAKVMLHAFTDALRNANAAKGIAAIAATAGGAK